MSILHLPWLELTVAIPLVGALWVYRLSDPASAQRQSIVLKSLTLVCAVGAWLDFAIVGTFSAHDPWDMAARLFGDDALVIDELSAPLLPLTALLYFATAVATLRTKSKRFSFPATLMSEAILLATIGCRSPWGIVALLIAGTIPPFFEIRDRRKPTGVYAVHMTVFAVLLIVGQAMLDPAAGTVGWSVVAIILLSAAVLIRSGTLPLHVWMTDLFEHATFGTALLFVTPMVGTYAAVRLVLPVAPDWALRAIALLSLATAVYAAGMALVQREARRFFCYLFLSHSSLVLVGLELATPIGLTAALSLWLSVALALAGFGLTLRSVEARTGRLSLTDYRGLSTHTPTLGAFFLLTGLAGVGFPGTFGFVGTELLVESAVTTHPFIGAVVVLSAALNGIAVVKAYFRVFAGPPRPTSISLRSRWSERWAVLVLTALILGGGLIPQPGITSRHHAAIELLRTRGATTESVSLGSDEANDVGGTNGASVGLRNPVQLTTVTE